MEQLKLIPALNILGFSINASVVTTWVLMVLLTVAGFLGSRSATVKPGVTQTVLQGAYEACERAMVNMLPEKAVPKIFPFVATLAIFILSANLIGLLPGVHSPTSDLSVTASLAVLVFIASHWFGIRYSGLKNYLRHYLQPNPIMLPFHIISEITRTLALALRLFGNIMSMQLAALIVLMIAGFLVPVPVLMLHIVEGVIQAYIFTMLALVYIAGGIQAHAARMNQTHKE